MLLCSNLPLCCNMLLCCKMPLCCNSHGPAAGGIARQHIAKAGPGGAWAGFDQLPAAAIGGGDDAMGPLQQHAGSGGVGGGGGSLQGGQASQIGEEPGKFGAMGCQPGRTLALAQPLVGSRPPGLA